MHTTRQQQDTRATPVDVRGSMGRRHHSRAVPTCGTAYARTSEQCDISLCTANPVLDGSHCIRVSIPECVAATHAKHLQVCFVHSHLLQSGCHTSMCPCCGGRERPSLQQSLTVTMQQRQFICALIVALLVLTWLKSFPEEAVL